MSNSYNFFGKIKQLAIVVLLQQQVAKPINLEYAGKVVVLP